MDLVGHDAEYVAQVWAEHMIYLTGKRTWFTLVEVANELLTVTGFPGNTLSDTILEAVFNYDDPRHEHAFEGLQRTREHMLSRGSEPLQMALQKAGASWPQGPSRP